VPAQVEYGEHGGSVLLDYRKIGDSIYRRSAADLRP
jgi:hypothetical protein